jgi:hypothetical protein
MLRVTYELAQRDFYEAIVAHRNSSVPTKWFLRFISFMWLGCLVIAVLEFAFRPDLQPQKSFLPIFLLGTFWMFIFWGSPWLAARNQLWKQPSAQGPRTMLLDAAGIHVQWNGGSSEIEWNNFVNVVESKNEFLIYSSPVIFNVLPKRALSGEQASEFRSLVAQNLASPQNEAKAGLF